MPSTSVRTTLSGNSSTIFNFFSTPPEQQPGTDNNSRRMQQVEYCIKAELANYNMQTMTDSPACLIPAKGAQLIFSLQGFFKKDQSRMEKIAHGVQIILTASQLVLLSLLFFRGQECGYERSPLCNYWTYSRLLYFATLSAGWGAGKWNESSRNGQDWDIPADEGRQSSVQDDGTGGEKVHISRRQTPIPALPLKSSSSGSDTRNTELYYRCSSCSSDNQEEKTGNQDPDSIMSIGL
jgi:hypothetical protein